MYTPVKVVLKEVVNLLIRLKGERISSETQVQARRIVLMLSPLERYIADREAEVIQSKGDSYQRSCNHEQR